MGRQYWSVVVVTLALAAGVVVAGLPRSVEPHGSVAGESRLPTDGQPFVFLWGFDGRVDVYQWEPAVGSAVRLTDSDAVETLPTRSADSRTVAYAINAAGQWVVERKVIATGKRDTWWVANRPIDHLALSPDGSALLVTEAVALGQEETYLVTNGGATSQTLGTATSRPAWSPRSDEFAIERDGHIELIRLDREGQIADRRIVAGGRSPQFTSDGLHIVFVDSVAGQLVRLDGEVGTSDTTPLDLFPVASLAAAELSLEPGGSGVTLWLPDRFAVGPLWRIAPQALEFEQLAPRAASVGYFEGGGEIVYATPDGPGRGPTLVRYAGTPDTFTPLVPSGSSTFRQLP